MKKVLIVTPRSPFKDRGADEQERMSGIRWFIDHGYETRVITKTLKNDIETIEASKKELGIQIIPVSYKFRGKTIGEILKRILYPHYWDGAAYEFFEPEIQEALEKELDDLTPDLVWFDHSHLWPLYDKVKKRGIPIVTRSIDFEPVHLFDEEGINLKTVALLIPKIISERQVARKSDVLCTLNPDQVRWYKWVGKRAELLPLRFLWEKLRIHQIRAKVPLHVLFMGSSYTVVHNLQAFKFVAQKLVPEVLESAPGEFVFHITGSKFPAEYEKYIDGQDIIYDGFVPLSRMDEYMASMDIVVSPAIKKVGMQGKVFEPLARGIPLITSRENLVGYPLEDAILPAESTEDYVAALLKARDLSLREGLSKAGSKFSRELFSREKVDEIMYNILAKLDNHG